MLVSFYISQKNIKCVIKRPVISNRSFFISINKHIDIKEKVMKLPTETKFMPIGILNAFTLTGVSMVWGHMLDLINPWFLPLTILVILIGYGSEISKTESK